MEEREPSSTIDLLYFKLLFQTKKFLTTLFRHQCKNYKWSKVTMYNCRDHEKSLCTIWFFVLHSKCLWEGNSNKESVQEWMTFAKTFMKSITKWHEECSENQNNQDLSEELRYNREQLSSIDEKVTNDRMKSLKY